MSKGLDQETPEPTSSKSKPGKTSSLFDLIKDKDKKPPEEGDEEEDDDDDEKDKEIPKLSSKPPAKEKPKDNLLPKSPLPN